MVKELVVLDLLCLLRVASLHLTLFIQYLLRYEPHVPIVITSEDSLEFELGALMIRGTESGDVALSASYFNFHFAPSE